MNAYHANLDVPSAWPIRNQRRQAALHRDLSHIDRRLHDIESKISSIATTLERILDDPKAALHNDQVEKDEIHESIFQISTRLERMG
eukprot:738336-Karenia_brevis.AAC.1